jgi:hypothetical protein
MISKVIKRNQILPINLQASSKQIILKQNSGYEVYNGNAVDIKRVFDYKGCQRGHNCHL